MAESTVVRNKRDAIITVTDGILSYVVTREAGTFTFSAPRQTVSLYLDRGLITATPNIRRVDDQPMTLGWDQYLTDLGDIASPQTYQTILDLLLELAGGYTLDAWTSTRGSSSDEKVWTVKWTLDGASFGESDKTYAFPFCSLRLGSAGDGDPNTVAITGTSYALQPTLS